MRIKKIFIVCSFCISILSGKSQVFDWASKFTGTGHDIAKSIKCDSNGDIIITGSFEDMVDFDPGASAFNLNSSGDRDIFIAKLNANGGLIWAKKIGSSTDEESFGLAVDLNNNIFLTGEFTSNCDFDPGIAVNDLNFSGGASDLFVLKLNSNGDFVWAKQIGGPNLEVGQSIDVDNAGNCFITGKFEGNVDFNPGTAIDTLTSEGTYDSFVLKLDSNGDFSWVHKIGSNYNFEFGYSIRVDAAGNVLASGSLGASNVDVDPGAGTSLISGGIYIIKYSNAGSFIWGKAYDAGFPYGLSTDGSNNVYSCGVFGFTTDLDPGAGVSNFTPNNGSSDIFIQKLDANGNYIWAKQIGGTSFDRGFSISNDASGNLVLSGEFGNTVDFDPGSGTYLLTAEPVGSACLVNLDSNGNFLWAGAVSFSNINGNTNSVYLTNSGLIYYASSFPLVGDLDPTIGEFLSTAAGIGTHDVFVSKIDLSQVNSDNFNQSYSSSFKIYPNPAHSKFTVEFNSPVENENQIQIEIFNSLGQLKHSQMLQTEVTEISLENLSTGLYFVSLRNQNEISHHNLIIY